MTTLSRWRPSGQSVCIWNFSLSDLKPTFISQWRGVVVVPYLLLVSFFTSIGGSRHFVGKRHPVKGRIDPATTVFTFKASLGTPVEISNNLREILFRHSKCSPI